jgi:4-hydroxybenzoyl-CoA thioesterase
MPAFRSKTKILFQHCDPAGIVFYPRYFEMLNAAVEDWFDRGLGVDFATLHGVRRRGIPTKHLDVTFSAPSRLGEEIAVEYAVEALGGASLTAVFRIVGPDGTVRLSGRQVLVHVDLERVAPVPWPDDLREAMAGYMSDDAELEV